MGGADAHLMSALADTRLVASLWVALLGTGSPVRPQRCSVDRTERVDKRKRRRERERQRQTDRQTDRDTDKQTDREGERQTDRQTVRQTVRQTDTQREGG